MQRTDGEKIQLSVRDLVEFVLRSGDLDDRPGAARIQEAMLAGARVHRRLQKAMGEQYAAEVPLKIRFLLTEEGSFLYREEADVPGLLTVEGRADGIYEAEDGVVIDEIKGVFRDISRMEGAEPVHLAQAEVYALACALDRALPGISVQLSYVELEEKDLNGAEREMPVRRFLYTYSLEQLMEKVLSYVEAYRPFALFSLRHRKQRADSAAEFVFPFESREGQRIIMRAVQRAVEQERQLYVQAPTGTGKTAAMLYPSVKAVGEGLSDRIFYLSAKNVTAGAAEDTMRLFASKGLAFSFIRIVAKEKLCPKGRADCDPVSCERARGHFDRVNEALLRIITQETAIDTACLIRYAEEYRLCPYEFALDVSYYCDVVICDYNYAFAPNVYLRRYFADGQDKDYIFLIDEAHNLADRAREMYSAVLYKEEVLAAKKLFPGRKKILGQLDRLNKVLLELKRVCDRVSVYGEDDYPNALVLRVEELSDALSEFLSEVTDPPGGDDIRRFFFSLRTFLDAAEHRGPDYLSYGTHDGDGRFYVRLFCIQPSERLKERLKHIRSAVFFSATFLPVNYYKELLSGSRDEDAVYVSSPFDPEKRALILCRDVSTAYRRRSTEEYRRIADLLLSMARAKKGNYLAFFPSHAFLAEVEKQLAGAEEIDVIAQKRDMTEEKRQAFLEEFRAERERTLLGLSVMGGVFSEGIDLKEEQLIGVAVVGTGLPMVSTERELIRAYYEQRGENGFDYAYRFPGFNKVMQAAGRLIRTDEDEGVIALLDERFVYSENRRLFPREWADHKITGAAGFETEVRAFWERRGD